MKPLAFGDLVRLPVVQYNDLVEYLTSLTPKGEKLEF